MNQKDIRSYLAGEAEDYQSLEAHDKIYHPGGYRDGDACKVRESIAKSDNPDKMIQRAGKYEDRTKTRKSVAGDLEKVFGDGVKFSEDDYGDNDSVKFQVSPFAGPLYGEKAYQEKLEDAGYKANVSILGWGPEAYVEGRIRKLTPEENLERVRAQKPKYDPDGSYKVDGDWYYGHDEAMTAWKAAMKKYGAATRKDVSSQHSDPRKKYLAMA